MTKLSTKFARAAKRVTSLISATAIAVAGLVAASSAPAQAAPVTKPQYVSITRGSSQDSAITIHAGEALRVYVSLNANITSDGVKQLSTDAAATTGIAGLTYGAKSYMWNFTGCTGSQMTVTTQVATPCAAATTVNGSVSQTITNSTGSDLSITTNASTAAMTYGGEALTLTHTNQNASRNPSTAELTNGIVYAQGDTYMSGSIQLCFNSSLVSANDVLTWDVSVLNGTTPVSSTWSMSDPYLQLMYYTMMNSVTAVTGETYTVDAPAISSGLNLNINSGGLLPGTYHFSVDLKKNNSSVLTTCATGPGPGGPVALLTNALGTTGAAVSNAAISSELPLGANITTSSAGANGPDGQGGLLVLSPSLNEGSWVLANLKKTGANSAFARTGKVTLSPGAGSMAGSTGWYGSGQTGWAADFFDMDGNSKIYWGTKAASTINQLTITSAMVSTFCTANAGAGFTEGGPGGMMEFDFLNAPTTAPMMIFTCINMSNEVEKHFIVKIATTGITKVVSTDSATTTNDKPCSTSSTFVNPAATGTGVAAIVVIANTAKASMGMGDPTCYSMSGAVGNRRLTTITSAGVAKVYTTNIPEAVVPAAAKGVALTPGNVSGTWVGVVSAGSPVAKPTHTIKVSATGVVTKLKNITLDADAVFSQTSSVIPIKQLASGSIIIWRRASVNGPSSAVKYTVGKIDPTGKVTSGKVLTLTATNMMDTYSNKNLARMSYTAAGAVAQYFVTKYTETPSGNKFKVVSWTSPAS